MSRPLLVSATRGLTRQSTCAFTHTTRPAPLSVSASSGSIRSLCCCSATTSRSTTYASQTQRHPRYTICRPAFSPVTTPQHRAAAFSTTSVRPDAKIMQNEKKDEDGKVMMVDISERAAERLREITDPTTSSTPTKEDNPYHHLRITVTSGGCHGFQYMMSLEAASKIDTEEDTVFEDASPAPAANEGQGKGKAVIVMDEPSLELLSGSTIDYTMELIGSQFTVVNNPRASSNCGCGTSFDVNV